MLRNPASRLLMTALLTVLSLAPSTLGWRGMIDCAKRCQLAHLSGAYCPLISPASASHPSQSHHCDMTAPQHHRQTELHCACPSTSPTSPVEHGSIRYLLPQPVENLFRSTQGFIPILLPAKLAPRFLSPPDPPPRSPVI